MRSPDWSFWLNQADVTVHDAILLSCNVDPRSIEEEDAVYKRGNEIALTAEYERRFAFVKSHIDARTLEVVRWGGLDRHIPHVTLAGFRAWGEKLPAQLSFAKEFPSTPVVATAATSSQSKAFVQRERNNLLRVIRALDVMAGLKDRGASVSVEAQLQQLGFNGPKEDTIRKLLDEARKLEPDQKPK